MEETNNLDALHPDRVAAHLPSAEQQYREMQDVNQFFDDTARVGASGTKIGLPGLRLLGREKTALLHERFTETGKVQKKEAKPIDFRDFIGKVPEGPKVKLVSLPLDICLDEGSESCLRKSVPPGQRVLTLTAVGGDMPEIGLKLGDTVRHTICIPCHKERKKGDSSGLQIPMEVAPGVYQNVPYGIIKTIEAGKRLARNVMQFAREAWTVRRENVFFDEHGEDITRER